MRRKICCFAARRAHDEDICVFAVGPLLRKDDRLPVLRPDRRRVAELRWSIGCEVNNFFGVNFDGIELVIRGALWLYAVGNLLAVWRPRCPFFRNFWCVGEVHNTPEVSEEG